MNTDNTLAFISSMISSEASYKTLVDMINDMELEALEGLIEEYETAGGENSFVHTVVQKEMYTWEKVIRE